MLVFYAITAFWAISTSLSQIIHHVSNLNETQDMIAFKKMPLL